MKRRGCRRCWTDGYGECCRQWRGRVAMSAVAAVAFATWSGIGGAVVRAIAASSLLPTSLDDHDPVLTCIALSGRGWCAGALQGRTAGLYPDLFRARSVPSLSVLSILVQCLMVDCGREGETGTPGFTAVVELPQTVDRSVWGCDASSRGKKSPTDTVRCWLHLSGCTVCPAVYPGTIIRRTLRMPAVAGNGGCTCVKPIQ